MKIKNLSFHISKNDLKNRFSRNIILIKIVDEKENIAWGEIAPLQFFSREKFQDCLTELIQKHDEIVNISWMPNSCLDQLLELDLYPSVLFGLESAILSLLFPISMCSINTSALLMGTYQEILKDAALRIHEGYTSAKLKVSNLNFNEAYDLIIQLKDKLSLRIDVNRAWSTLDSLHFFSQFSKDAFDYVEEPFQDPNDLKLFKHPLAVDESFPHNLSLDQLELIPMLKALIYKPTIQGGMTHCLSLLEWANKQKVEIVLSSSFESDLGLSHIAMMAQRLSLSAPVGIGTYHCLNKHICKIPLKFKGSILNIEGQHREINFDE